MEHAALLAALLELAQELGLEVRRIGASAAQDGLAPAASGVVRLRGRVLVMLFAGDPPERQADVLARALRAHAGDALEMRFLPPAIRAWLERGA
jgi:hypothetical protein